VAGRGGDSLGAVEVLDPGAVDKALAEGIGWERHGSELVKVHTGRAFADALAYVNAVGDLAERADHHPDIDIRWNKVTLRLSTHSAGGITEADLSLARQIDGLPGSGA
jgi:4a-hydroxytetrahydrobiopterin dehydratase